MPQSYRNVIVIVIAIDFVLTMFWQKICVWHLTKWYNARTEKILSDSYLKVISGLKQEIEKEELKEKEMDKGDANKGK